jgi:hypothetical protein
MDVSLPRDTLALVASWVKRNDLLALRAASEASRDAVREAVVGHADIALERNIRGIFFSHNNFHRGPEPLDPRKVEAVGRVFGGGCKAVKIIAGSDDLMGAYRSFIANAQSGLGYQSFISSSHRGLAEMYVLNAIPLHRLAELCSLAPRLREMYLRNWSEFTEPELVDFAAQVGLACPLIERFRFAQPDYCAAELFNMHFPKSEAIEFGARTHWYTPTRFDKIEESIARCETRHCNFQDTAVEPELIECLLRTSLSDRLEELSFDNTVIEESTILQAARGFCNLRSLGLPGEDTDKPAASLAFHKSLANLRPELIELNFGTGSPAGLGVMSIVFARYRLKRVFLIEMPNLTPALVNIILASPCSETLEEISLVFLFLPRVADVLRLVRGCPNLVGLEWVRNENEFSEDDIVQIASIRQIIRDTRGGWLDVS